MISAICMMNKWSANADRPTILICHTEKGRGVPEITTHPEHNFKMTQPQYQQALHELAEYEKKLVSHAY
jgi:transketolase